MSKPALAPAADPFRTAELKLIHVAKKNLALTDDSYRDVIKRLSGGRVDSSAKLTPTERQKVIKYFRDLGFEPTAQKQTVFTGARAPARRTLADDHRPQVGKLQALWYALYQLGVVRKNDREACAAFVCRHTGIEALRWNDSGDLHKAIECLKAWCEREGYHPQPYKSPPTAPGAPQEGSFSPGLIEAQWRRLIALGAFPDAGVFAGLDNWMRKMGWPVTTPGFLEHEAADDAIRRLGHWIRRLTPKSEGDDG